ncbi:MAG: histidine kinase N-terminal 7TM domain-containing protein [Halapricum sp.]
MAWQLTGHVVVIFLAAVVSAGWALYAVVSQTGRKWRSHVISFVVLNLGVAQWTLFYAFEVASTATATKLAAYKLLHIGGVVVPVAWFLFALTYTDNDRWVTPASIGALSVVPVAFLATLTTNPASLALAEVNTISSGGIELLTVEQGPMYALFLIYSYVLLLAGGFVLVRGAIGQNELFKRATGLLILGTAVPFVVNILTVTEVFSIGQNGLNYTPVSLSLSAFLFGIVIFRYRIFSLTPIARETTMENMREGVVVLSKDAHVVDINPAARDLLDIDMAAVGEVAGEVLPQYETLPDSADDHLDVTIDHGDDKRFLRMSRSPITTGEVRGWVVILHDVTARERRAREIERQNKRLDAFTDIVAHDIRNPLTTITSHTELARETGDPEHLEAIEDSATRIEDLIDGLLTLAREGKMIDEREPVSIGDIAADGWSFVETTEATLEMETEMRLEADPDRLQQVFENLFRNAIEHAGPDVHVSVGEIEGTPGFYVEDDGPGMSRSERARVFDAGFSTGGTGTGLGLNIVQEVVKAHGWSIDVMTSAGAGARFEITGVDIVR